MPVPKGKRYGGRQKGTPNKVTAEIKSVAQEYGAKAVEVLADVMLKSDQPAVRVAAAKELLLRS